MDTLEIMKLLQQADDQTKQSGKQLAEAIEHFHQESLKEEFLKRNGSLKFHLKRDPGECKVVQTDGTNLGYVQSVTLTAKVGEPTKAVVDTICTEAEAEVLKKDTQLNVTIMDAEAFKLGYESVINPQNVPCRPHYEQNSYGEYLFQKGRTAGYVEIGERGWKS